MRIIAGRHKGRPFRAPNVATTRPVTDSARETIFNILHSYLVANPSSHIGSGEEGGSDEEGGSGEGCNPRLPTEGLKGHCILDAFCGSGSFGLEALSRGAGSVVFMDWQRQALMQSRENALTLGEEEKSLFLCRNALRPGRPPPWKGVPATLFFLSPPWTKNYYHAALGALWRKGWMGEGALGIVESSIRQTFDLPHGFLLLHRREQGDSLFTLLQTYRLEEKMTLTDNPGPDNPKLDNPGPDNPGPDNPGPDNPGAR